MKFKTIPVFRIFGETKAKEFYDGFLGMKIDWLHRFEVDSPMYMQVSKGNLIFHLSEHSGDGTPDSKIMVNVKRG